MEQIVIARKLKGAAWWALLVNGHEVYSNSSIDDCLSYLETWSRDTRPTHVTLSLLSLDELASRQNVVPMTSLFRDE